MQSYHCPTCGVCLYGFDHHCTWLGVCIAARNYRWFFTLIVHLFITTFIISISFGTLILFVIRNTGWSGFWWHLALGCAFTVMWAFFSLKLLIYNTSLSCKNISTYEHIKGPSLSRIYNMKPMPKRSCMAFCNRRLYFPNTLVTSKLYERSSNPDKFAKKLEDP